MGRLLIIHSRWMLKKVTERYILWLEIIMHHFECLHNLTGVFFEKFVVSNFEVELRTFAHRFYHKVIISQIYAKPLTQEGKSKDFFSLFKI